MVNTSFFVNTISYVSGCAVAFIFHKIVNQRLQTGRCHFYNTVLLNLTDIIYVEANDIVML